MNRSRTPAIARTVSQPPRRTLSYAADVLVFVIAAGGSFVVHLIGDIPIADLILIPILPALIFLRPERLRRPRVGLIFVLLGLWLFGQIVTDVYRGTDSGSWMRGDARVLFIAMNLLGLIVLVGRNVRRHAIFIAGYALGSLVHSYLQPNPSGEQWKFGYGSGVTMAVLLVSCFFYKRRKYTVVVFLLLLMSAVHAAFNFRSPILTLFVTTVVVTPLIPERIGRLTILPAAGSGMRVFVLAIMAAAAAKAAGSLVLFLGTEGYLGETARLKNEVQANSKLGQLIGGRSEILVSSVAVMDSPILGHGSWARDMKYVDMYRDLLVQNGIQEEGGAEEETDLDLIPTHSHIMDAWVDAGILGAVFWIYILMITVKGLLRVGTLLPPLAPIYCYLLVGFVFALFFSPPGGITILPDTFLIIVACDLLDISLPARPLQRAPGRLGLLARHRHVARLSMP